MIEEDFHLQRVMRQRREHFERELADRVVSICETHAGVWALVLARMQPPALVAPVVVEQQPAASMWRRLFRWSA